MSQVDDGSKEALAIMGHFIAEGLIEAKDIDGNEHWQLTSHGYFAAEIAMEKLTDRQRALALLLADHIIRRREGRLHNG